MALNIKNPETERLARELARRRGQGITEAVTDVLRREVERERREPPRGDDLEERLRRINEIVEEVKKLPVQRPPSCRLELRRLRGLCAEHC